MSTCTRPDRAGSPGARRAAIPGVPGMVTGAVLALVLAMVPGIAAATVGASPDGSPSTTSGAAPEGSAPRGRWQVTRTPDGHRVTWHSPEPLPQRAARPEMVASDGTRTPALVAGDGRRVFIEVMGGATPDPDSYDVVLSGRLLDHRGEPLARSAPERAAATAMFAPGRRLLADDPAAPGVWPTVTSTYRRDPIRVPGMRRPIEMVGHVVAPARSARTGPRPLVLMLHGRHQTCRRGARFGGNTWPCRAPEREIRSERGFDYLQQRLASQGFVTASIRANGISAQDGAAPDGGAAARARLVRAHLALWVARAGAAQVDLSRVVLIGHSRGGEGVNLAAAQIPLSAPYRVVGQVLLAPTGFGAQSVPHVNTVTVLPSCDGDVSDLAGQLYTDRARDLVDADPALHSSVLVVGANHNWFNTEWTPRVASGPADDDWSGADRDSCGRQDPQRLSSARQRSVALAYVSGAVRLFATGAQQYAPLFTGEDVRVASTGTAAVRSHATGRGAWVLRPGRELRVGAGSTARVRECRGVPAPGPVGDACPVPAGTDPVTPHWLVPGTHGPSPTLGSEVRWQRAGAVAEWASAAPVDLSTGSLVLRTVVDPAGGRVGFTVRITDGAGRSARLDPIDGGVLDPLPGGAERGLWWAQSTRVDPVPGAVDLRDVRTIALVSTSARGHVVLLDMAGGAGSQVVETAVRAPLVSMARLRLAEGDGPGTRSAVVPVLASAPLPEGARVRVTGLDPARQPFERTLTARAGQRRFDVGVSWVPDRLFGADRRWRLQVWADRGVVTDTWNGGLRVVENDPRPRVRVRPVRREVREGRPIRLRVVLTDGLADEVQVSTRFRAVRGAALSTDDLTARYLGGRRVPPVALARSGHRAWRSLPAGRSRMQLRIPTRRDGLVEPPEKVRIQVRVALSDGRVVKRTVAVTVLDAPNI